MDGVLVKTIHLAEQIAREKLSQNGVEVTAEDIEHLAGYTWKEFLEYIYVSRHLDPIAGLYEDIIKTYSARLPNNVILYDQAVDVLANLQTKYTLALASGSLRHDVETNLEKFGLKRFFKVIVTGSDVNRGKPEPDIYLKALEGLSLASTQCIAVEDTILGIQSVKNAGLKCIAVTHTMGREKLSEADFVIDNLRDICPILVSV